MYEEYMQNYFNYPMNGYPNTYDQMNEMPYNYGVNNYMNSYNPYYYGMPTRITENELEKFYPEIYKIVYPMIKKSVMQNNYRGATEETINNIIDDIYSNVDTENKEGLKDLIKILVIREFIGKSSNNFNRPMRYAPVM